MKFIDLDFNKIPKEKGIYIILKNTDFKFNIIEGDYSKLLLTEKYEKIKDSNILYIGKAGGKRGLYQRLKQYLNQGNCNGKNHRGGRAIFQLAGWQNLEVKFTVDYNCELTEKYLLSAYKNKYGVYPLANFRN